MSYRKKLDRIAVVRTAFAAERKGFVRMPGADRIVVDRTDCAEALLDCTAKSCIVVGYMSVDRTAVAVNKASYTELVHTALNYMAIPEWAKKLLQRKRLENIESPKKDLLFPIDNGSRKRMANRMSN